MNTWLYPFAIACLAVGALMLVAAAGYGVGVTIARHRRDRLAVARQVNLAAGIREERARDGDNSANPWAVCGCGHLWMRHDVNEYSGDGSETCCVEGCDQSGCPGRSSDEVLGEDPPVVRAYVTGMVPYGTTAVHERCRDARRDGRPGEICGRCAVEFVRPVIAS